ncbi:MAG: TIGR03557 family F420-dependent LLM class oxidoreductase [Actinomycetota bacterium]|nr:TIGR03557 family F420-dependent LLM class oxidoreductase [Actinomycetota bacterium]
MVQLGYALSCEEHRPSDLVTNARRAEDVGYGFALISDHFHPWLDAQGQSPFVWNVIGAIAQVTDALVVGTGVTCPTMRVHPAIVAQAAATSAAMLPGRFFLGVGSGERLNEHVTGAAWPATDVRHDMLEEAIEVIRALWTGDVVTHRGRHYTVEDARLYTLPDDPPPLAVAASGPSAAELAGRLGDALVGLAPSSDVVGTFRQAGGDDKPRYGQITVCWAESEDEAVRTAMEHWPQIGLTSDENTEFRTPKQFEQAVQLVTEDRLTQLVACGPDPERHLEMIDRFSDAGYDHVYLHQVGPDQDGFLRFSERELIPRLS